MTPTPGAPFHHHALGEIWIDKVTPTHISFTAPCGNRRFSRVKYTLEEFRTGIETYTPPGQPSQLYLPLTS